MRFSNYQLLECITSTIPYKVSSLNPTYEKRFKVLLIVKTVVTVKHKQLVDRFCEICEIREVSQYLLVLIYYMFILKMHALYSRFCLMNFDNSFQFLRFLKFDA